MDVKLLEETGPVQRANDAGPSREWLLVGPRPVNRHVRHFFIHCIHGRHYFKPAA